MTKLNGLRASAWLLGVTFMGGAGLDTAAHAADLGYMPAPEMAGPRYGYLNPFTDPRCRIIPVPEMSLYGFGETARFRPTAVCQSRGLYTDSVVLP